MNSENELDGMHQYLQQHGLTEQEATIVVTMHLAPQITAKELSENTGISEIRMYQLLANLSKRSIVQHTNTKPKLFDAKPDDVISALLGEKQRQIERLKKAKPVYLKIARTLYAQSVQRLSIAEDEFEKLEVENGSR